MKVYTCSDAQGKWANAVAVITAHDEAEARGLLDAALTDAGLVQEAEFPYTLDQVSTRKAQAVILDNGDE